jgi:hypothetical protein
MHCVVVKFLQLEANTPKTRKKFTRQRANIVIFTQKLLVHLETPHPKVRKSAFCGKESLQTRKLHNLNEKLSQLETGNW